MIENNFVPVIDEELYSFVTLASNVYNGKEKILDTFEKFKAIDFSNIYRLNYFCQKESNVLCIYNDKVASSDIKSIFLNGILLVDSDYYSKDRSLIIDCKTEPHDVISIFFYPLAYDKAFMINNHDNNLNEKIKLNNIINNFNNVVKTMKRVE